MEAIGRVAVAEVNFEGDAMSGNCLFNAKCLEGVRCSNQDAVDPQGSWREACATEMKLFVNAMQYGRGVWSIKEINTNQPERPEDMPDFVNQLNVWSSNFEVALMAKRLDDYRRRIGGDAEGEREKSGRLILLAAEVYTNGRFSVCLPPSPELLLDEKELQEVRKVTRKSGGWAHLFAPRQAIQPEDITERDEVIVNLGFIPEAHDNAFFLSLFSLPSLSL